MSDLINGLYPKPKNDKAPDFVIGKLSINIDQFRDWMKQHIADNPGEDWINVDMKVSKGGKGYAALDTWKPDQSAGNAPAKAEEFADSPIPF